MKRNWRKISAVLLALAFLGVVAGGMLAKHHFAVLAGLALGLVLLVFVLLIMLGRLNALYVHQREVVLHDLLPGMRADAEGQNARIEGVACAVSEIQLTLSGSQEFHRQQYSRICDALNSTVSLLQAVAADACAERELEAAAREREADARQRLITEVGAIRVGVSTLLEAAVSGLELASETSADLLQRVDGRLDLLRAEVCSRQDTLTDSFRIEAFTLKSQISTLAEYVQRTVERDLMTVCAEIKQSTLRSGERAEQLLGQLSQDFTLIASRLDEAAGSTDDRIAGLSEQLDVKLAAVAGRLTTRLDETTGNRDRLLCSGMEKLSSASSALMDALTGFDDAMRTEFEVISGKLQASVDRTDERLVGLSKYINSELASSLSRVSGHVNELFEDRLDPFAQEFKALSSACDALFEKFRQLDDASRDSASELSGKLDRASSDVGKSTLKLVSLVEDVRKGASKSLINTGRRLEAAINNAQARNDVEKSRQTNELIQNMDALFQLRSTLPESSIGPLLGDWAMDPVGMQGVIDLIFSCRPDQVLECGSGASTVWIARAMEMLGRGEVTSIEHLEEYAAKTKQAIERESLSSRAKVVLAPVEETRIDGVIYNWYGTRGLRIKPASIDLLLVDGPPGDIGPSARYPALPVLKNFLAERAFILLDDCDRPNEIEIEKRWLAENPELSISGRVGPRTILMMFQRVADKVN